VVHAKNYKTVSTFVKVNAEKNRDLFLCGVYVVYTAQIVLAVLCFRSEQNAQSPSGLGLLDLSASHSHGMDSNMNSIEI